MTTDWISKITDKKFILYVDKLWNFNEAIDNFNDDDDYIIVPAFDVNNAIEKAIVLKNKIDLLIIDIDLSDTNKIPSDRFYEKYFKGIISRDIPIIFQAPKGINKRYIFTYRVNRLINNGIADVIYKPYTKEELLTAIEELKSKFGDRINAQNE